jgi:hypothetical protein
VTGMQTARLKAESQGRKAKVHLIRHLVLLLEKLPLQDRTVGCPETNILCDSLPTRTMSYWSMFHLSVIAVEG